MENYPERIWVEAAKPWPNEKRWFSIKGMGVEYVRAGMQVKALEWDGDDYIYDGERQAYFNATGADYSHYHIVLEGETWKLTRRPSARHAYEDTIGLFPTLEASKSAAQADYETRIRSALIAPPAADNSST